MDAHRWQRIDDLFQAAVARPAEERPAFLDEACGADDGLRHQLGRLVRAHERSTGFLETPVATDAFRILASADEASTVQPALTAFRAGTEFRGTERFTVRRQLGAGGMGIVYEVHDRVRNDLVALKTLLRARAVDIYRLKREFRSLADVAHPNLVSLYELIVEGVDCFFTMELVHGVNLVEYVRGSTTTALQRAERIRHVFRQLVEGINALHRSGKLHRDIKPSNVLITPAGRVVILDFGLAGDVFPDDAAVGESMAGTPAYLAPERGAGAAPSEGHDWYSVGVTLYEALTGRVPFDGPLNEVLRRKRETDPRPPAEIAPAVPDELNALCMGLLRRDPVQRLTGRETARILDRDSAVTIARPSQADAELTFVGRHRQLNALETALAEAKHGTATAVYVHGPSGIGKSALVQCFLDRALKREDIVVLRGRCYEYESVPYKALDGVVDSLSRHLSALPRWQANPLLPPDLAALSRLFPVMLQVEAASSVQPREHGNADPLVLRQRAFTALRELLARMAARRPLVVYIDDLHWADADSAALLEELLRPPQAPPILTVACFRTEEIASKPFLQALLQPTASKADVALPLEPMSDDEGRTLLALSLDMKAPVSDEEILEIARQAGGNPFLLRQLGGYLATCPTRRNRVTFAEMLDERIRALPREGQRFLETLAVCGRPMAPELVCDACGIVRERQSLVAILRSSRFIRSSGSSERVEPYHDRIREVLAAQIAPDPLRRIHRLMAQALVDKRSSDHDALFEHYRGAGDDENAAMQAGLAAAKAGTALAFDRAAAFYAHALALAPASPSASGWSEGLANALANAGRPAEAGAAYLRAAAGADPSRRVELQRRGAEQFLIGGYIDRGLDLIRRMLTGMGVGASRGPRAALLSLWWRRAQLRWRGLHFVPRRADEIDADTLLRVDTCWSVFTGLAMIDYVRAADFHTRHLLLALDAGEPYRLARALAAETVVVGSAGGPRRRQAIQCAARADAMAERAGELHAVALCTLTRGASEFLTGNWPVAETYCDRALTVLRDHAAGTIWELNSVHVFRLGALLYQGKLREAARDVAALLASAKGRGNLYFETELRTRMNLVWLVADDPDEGEQQANEALQQWARVGFQRMHYNYMVDRIQTELYRGRPRAAWQVISDSWSALERSQLLRVQFQRIEARYLRARSALLMAATARNPRKFLSIARVDARNIRRERMAWSDPLSCLLSATVACLGGRPQVARDRLAEAAAGFERAHMTLYLAVARRRLGEIAQDDASHEARRHADGWMAAQGVVNPSRITRLIAPGFPDADMP